MTTNHGLGDSIPEVPEEHGDEAQTVGAQPLVAQQSDNQNSVLGRNIAADLSGMAAASTDVPFNRAAIAGINYAMFTQQDAKARAERLHDTLSTECMALREQLRASEVKAARLEATLIGIRASSNLRAVLNTLSGVVLACAPYAFDKAGLWAAIAVCVGGILLLSIASSWRRQQ